MRPLALTQFEPFAAEVRALRWAKKCAWLISALGAGAVLHGCAQGSPSVVSVPPRPSIHVSVAPQTGSVTLGNMQALTASVTGTGNTAVTWSVTLGPAGAQGGSAAAGMITSAGVYTA